MIREISKSVIHEGKRYNVVLKNERMKDDINGSIIYFELYTNSIAPDYKGYRELPVTSNKYTKCINDIICDHLDIQKRISDFHEMTELARSELLNT